MESLLNCSFIFSNFNLTGKFAQDIYNSQMINSSISYTGSTFASAFFFTRDSTIENCSLFLDLEINLGFGHSWYFFGVFGLIEKSIIANLKVFGKITQALKEAVETKSHVGLIAGVV